MSHYSRSFLTFDDDDDEDLLQLMSRRIELQHSISPYRHRPIHFCTFSKRRYAPSPPPSFDFNFDSDLDSVFPLARHSHRFQTDYHRVDTHRRANRRWKSVVCILIFYFRLKENLRRAKGKPTYYQRDYHRLRFLELLTAVHRVYFEPNSAIYKCLAMVVQRDAPPVMKCAATILDQLIHFRPQFGILGTSSDESVLIYLLQCSLNDYPRNYFWSIERHLLSLSYAKMKELRHEHLDHFTTKFIVLSTFVFRGLVKTLLLKPVKYRLTRGQLSETQWLNTRLLSSLILSAARHAIMRPDDRSRLPMPFPFEMKTYLFDDDRLEEEFADLQRFVGDLAPKLSAWASRYADRLQNYFEKN